MLHCEKFRLALLLFLCESLLRSALFCCFSCRFFLSPFSGLHYGPLLGSYSGFFFPRCEELGYLPCLFLLLGNLFGYLPGFLLPRRYALCLYPGGLLCRGRQVCALSRLLLLSCDLLRFPSRSTFCF